MEQRYVGPADIAMLRGVMNCGEHHEENKLAPALEFARECSVCAGSIFVVIWNAAVAAAYKEANEQLRSRRLL